MSKAHLWKRWAHVLRCVRIHMRQNVIEAVVHQSAIFFKSVQSKCLNSSVKSKYLAIDPSRSARHSPIWIVFANSVDNLLYDALRSNERTTAVTFSKCLEKVEPVENYHDFGVTHISCIRCHSFSLGIHRTLLDNLHNVFTNKPFPPFRNSISLCQNSRAVQYSILHSSRYSVLRKYVTTETTISTLSNISGHVLQPFNLPRTV